MNRQRILVWALLLVFPLSVIAAKKEPEKVELTGTTIMPTQLVQIQATKQEKVTVVDVREIWEYNRGHIENVVFIPLGKLPFNTEKVPRDHMVVIVCAGGNRSVQARKYLNNQGFQNIYTMEGGMAAWAKEGHPLELTQFKEE